MLVFATILYVFSRTGRSSTCLFFFWAFLINCATMSNEEPRGRSRKMAERPIQNFDERSDLIPTSNISPINPPIRSMLCPVLCWIRCQMALRSAGALRFPRRYCVCEKCLPQAAQEYKSRMRDSLEAKCSIRHGMILISDMRAMKPSAFAIANIHLAVRAFQPKNYSSYLSSMMLA